MYINVVDLLFNKLEDGDEVLDLLNFKKNLVVNEINVFSVDNRFQYSFNSLIEVFRNIIEQDRKDKRVFVGGSYVEEVEDEEEGVQEGESVMKFVDLSLDFDESEMEVL